MVNTDHVVGRRFAIAIHGGVSDSGTADKAYETAAKGALADTIDMALRRLMDGDSALDVAEAAVISLEDVAVSNAGKGAAFNKLGGHELEAAIVDGSTRRIGAVAGMQSTRNPIKVARHMLESGRQTLIAGPAADELANANGLEQVDNSYFNTEYDRLTQASALSESEQESMTGTVGATVLDVHGCLAAAASSGGLRGKDLGRIEDIATPGSGIWADDSLAIVCSGSGDEILQHSIAAKMAGLACRIALINAVKTTIAEFSQDTESICSVLALRTTGELVVESSGRLFVTASGFGKLGNDETHREIHFVPITVHILPHHEFMRDGRFVAGTYRYPITPGHAVVVAETTSNVTTLNLHDFINLFRFTRKTAQALVAHTGVQRCALASDGTILHLIPLHGLSDRWSSICCPEEEPHATFPGYFTSKNGPKISSQELNEIQCRLVSVSDLKEPINRTFLGDPTDQNLFARIVRGELEQWRIWESDSHVAFLTPFGNTPGFTVLVPRRHLSSDVFALSDEDYVSLVDAAYVVASIIKRGLGVARVGIFFEGFEIDYTHAKLIPVHENGPLQTVVPPAAFHMCYPGFITTQPGPREKDTRALKAFTQGLQGDVGHPGFPFPRNGVPAEPSLCPPSTISSLMGLGTAVNCWNV